MTLCKLYAIQKHPWCKKSEAKSEAPVISIFCMRLKDVISGRGQGLLGFNHFVYEAIYDHVQTNRNNACRQTIETPEQLKEPIAVHDCGQHLSNSQL